MLTGTYRFPPMESVVYGRPFAEAVTEAVDRSGANAVFLLASGTLDRDTDMVDQIRRAIGNRLAGVHARIGAHTPRTDVVDAANAARAAGADLLLTLGGGSVTDAAKMVAFCLGNGWASQRMILRRTLSLCQSLLHDDIDGTPVFRVHANQSAIFRSRL